MTADGPQLAAKHNSPGDVLLRQVTFVDNDRLVTEDQLPAKYSDEFGTYHAAFRFAVRSATDGSVLTALDCPYHEHGIRQLLASPDGKQFVACHGTFLCVYDATNWQITPTAIAGTTAGNLRAACFHPRAYFLLANNGPSVVVYDTTTWKPARRWNWKSGAAVDRGVAWTGRSPRPPGLAGTSSCGIWTRDPACKRDRESEAERGTRELPRVQPRSRKAAASAARGTKGTLC